MFLARQVLLGERVLIVEDEMLVALMIEDFLIKFGCGTVGPCSSVAPTMNVAQTETFDLAVLEVNLDGEMFYLVGEMLAERHTPFLFLSGCGDAASPPDLHRLVDMPQTIQGK